MSSFFFFFFFNVLDIKLRRREPNRVFYIRLWKTIRMYSGSLLRKIQAWIRRRRLTRSTTLL